MSNCAAPTTTYYTNTNYAPLSGSNWCPPTTGYYTKTSLGGQDYGALTSLCDAQCNLYSPLCKAYIATDTLNYFLSQYDVVCSLYTTQLPAPEACVSDTPDDLYAAYRDDTNSCFSQSVSDAVRFCSYALGKDDPATITDYTATISPVATTTSVSYVTKSVCVVPSGGKRRNAAGYDDELPEATPEPAALTNAARQPQPTIAPRRPPPVQLPPQPRANSAPAPACLNTIDYPAWNYISACSCLSTVTALTEQADTTASTTTVVVRSTRTTRVQKSSVPTFQPKASVAGSSAQFSLLSREIPDKNGVPRRVLLYTKPSRAAAGQISMHINPDKNLFLITKDLNNLKSAGRLTFVTTQAGIPVLGQLPSGSSGPGSSDVLYNCAVGSDNVISCKLKTGEAAVFSEVAIPGQKNAYFVAVGNQAMKGAKVISLISTQTGTVIVGCGGTAP